MVKVRGPLLSIDASGTLADSLTFSKWKGRAYVRKRVEGTNPQSGPQVGRRALFAFLTQQWDAISAGDQATWQDLADELQVSPFHAFLSQNQAGWHNFLAPSIATPATRTGSLPGVSTPTVGWFEGNRIAIGTQLSAVNDNWGVLVFCTPNSVYDTAVGNCIFAFLLQTTDVTTWYWTPPTWPDYWTNSRYFTVDGKLGAETGCNQVT